MVDVTIIGGGDRARDCGEVLSRSGFSLAHSFEIEENGHGPVILGDVNGGFQVAREVMDSGRHLLIAGTQHLTPERLTLLLEQRRSAQALFVWSERRYHPGYRFVAGLTESDNTWKPRFIRQEMLSPEQPTSVLFRWRTLECIALLNSIAASDPLSVNATAVHNAKRNAPDMVSMAVSYRDIEAQLVVGLGEVMDRRETLVASSTRKAFVDELNPNLPIRIVDDQPSTLTSARWLACASPSTEELARQQCIAFLDSTLHAQHTVEESTLWTNSLATLASMEQSLMKQGPADVVLMQDEPRFRIIGGLHTLPPSVA
jgi:hypothetical protein